MFPLGTRDESHMPLTPTDINKILLAFLVSYIHATCPTHVIPLDFITIIFPEDHTL
jgi:hypothetical protein